MHQRLAEAVRERGLPSLSFEFIGESARVSGVGSAGHFVNPGGFGARVRRSSVLASAG